MKRYRSGSADERARLRERLTEILAESPRNACNHAGSIQPIESLADELDRAAAFRDQEISLRLFERQRDLAREILGALDRIEKGHYGICENCGEEIGTRRLKVFPMATLCIGCKREEEDRAKKKALSFMKVSSPPA